jgi:hypothetical protein
MTNDPQRRIRIRLTAVILGLVALGFYFAFFVVMSNR